MSDSAALLPPNATALERALVDAAARATDIPPPVRELWDVDTCPEPLLPWLAWALNMQTWRASWPVAVKRARIRSAVDVHRRKGTAASVRSVVASFGADISLREWWQTSPKGTPHTFSVVLNIGGSLPQDAGFQQSIAQAIDLTKPVRSQYDLSVTTTSTTSVGVLAASQAITYRRLNLQD
ncbi:MAG: phage tail protein I [Salinisphaera sp.]|jgi:phage tail P2-like protein|nr:phage tail protein I [Salinisphaera sp.]